MEVKQKERIKGFAIALVVASVLCAGIGIVMAAWDDTKETSDILTATEWNNMVTDQKNRLLKDGSVLMTGDLSFGDNNIDGISEIKFNDRIKLAVGALVAQDVNLSGGNVFTFKLNGNTTPWYHDEYDLGTAALRWQSIYVNNTHFGDIGFVETTSPNDKPFEIGDTVTLTVVRFCEESGDVMTVPIHITETKEYQALEARIEALERDTQTNIEDRRDFSLPFFVE